MGMLSPNDPVPESNIGILKGGSYPNPTKPNSLTRRTWLSATCRSDQSVNNKFYLNLYLIK